MAPIAARDSPQHVTWWWLFANLVAWTLVFALLPAPRLPDAAVYAAGGCLVAVPQHWLLARWCREPWWHVSLSATAWALSLFLSVHNAFFGYLAVEWLAFLGAPVAAVVQYTAIRPHARRALWWVPASSACMYLAAWVGTMAGSEAYDHYYRPEWLYLAIGGAAGGATYGLLSGLALAALLGRFRHAAPATPAGHSPKQ